jgi:hypothetical protein
VIGRTDVPLPSARTRSRRWHDGGVHPLPGDVDPKLWVEVDGVDGRCYLSYNCHTFPGRMGAWSETLSRDLCVSKSQVTAASEEAKYWMDGFLTGTQPRAVDMFGLAIHDAEDSDPRWERWRAAIADFRRTGVWPHGRWDGT